MVGSPLVAFPLVGGLEVTTIDNLAAKGPIMDPFLASHGYQANTPDGLDAALLDEISSGMVVGGAPEQLEVSCHDTPSMTVWGEAPFTLLPLAILELQLYKF